MWEDESDKYWKHKQKQKKKHIKSAAIVACVLAAVGVIYVLFGRNSEGETVEIGVPPDLPHSCKLSILVRPIAPPLLCIWLITFVYVVNGQESGWHLSQCKELCAKYNNLNPSPDLSNGMCLWRRFRSLYVVHPPTLPSQGVCKGVKRVRLNRVTEVVKAKNTVRMSVNLYATKSA